MTKPVTPARRSAPRTLRAFLTGPPAVSQRALAAAVGCNQSMISMLVKGKRVPSARLAVQLHAITGVPLRALLGLKLPPERPTARGDPPRTRPGSPARP